MILTALFLSSSAQLWVFGQLFIQIVRWAWFIYALLLVCGVYSLSPPAGFGTLLLCRDTSYPGFSLTSSLIVCVCVCLTLRPFLGMILY